jgi:nucleotide-binding universal stress UspA family protein
VTDDESDSPIKRNRSKSMSTKRIVVGLDGSDESRAALRWAWDQAVATGAQVVAVLAYSFELAWIDIGSDIQAKIMEQAATKARERLHEFISATLPAADAAKVHPLVVEGSPAVALVETARTADLLVVGTRGRGGFAGLLLGSVSQRCVEHAPCAVVVIPRPVKLTD